MMMGIGTPSSHSNIERPMSASFFVSGLNWRLLNGQAVVFVPRQILPGLERSLNLLQEGRPLLSGGMIHIVIGEVVAAHGVAWH